MKTFKDYLDLYLKTDVLLLADIIENYRDVTRKSYNLDPLHFLTAPALSFQAALKYTDIKLELLTDMDMLNFIVKGLRGGMAYIAKRKAETKDNKNLLYLDKNNLYGYSMMQPMPTGGFKWIEEGELPVISGTYEQQMERILASDVSYILEVDAVFNPEIHDLMADFPFLPENVKPPGGKTVKLMNHLGPRHRYVVSYEMYLLAKNEGE